MISYSRFVQNGVDYTFIIDAMNICNVSLEAFQNTKSHSAPEPPEKGQENIDMIDGRFYMGGGLVHLLFISVFDLTSLSFPSVP